MPQSVVAANVTTPCKNSVFVELLPPFIEIIKFVPAIVRKNNLVIPVALYCAIAITSYVPALNRMVFAAGSVTSFGPITVVRLIARNTVPIVPVTVVPIGNNWFSPHVDIANVLFCVENSLLNPQRITPLVVPAFAFIVSPLIIPTSTVLLFARNIVLFCHVWVEFISDMTFDAPPDIEIDELPVGTANCMLMPLTTIKMLFVAVVDVYISDLFVAAFVVVVLARFTIGVVSVVMLLIVIEAPALKLFVIVIDITFYCQISNILVGEAAHPACISLQTRLT